MFIILFCLYTRKLYLILILPNLYLNFNAIIEFILKNVLSVSFSLDILNHEYFLIIHELAWADANVVVLDENMCIFKSCFKLVTQKLQPVKQLWCFLD